MYGNCWVEMTNLFGLAGLSSDGHHISAQPFLFLYAGTIIGRAKLFSNTGIDDAGK
jgi:hypothetical protein